MLTQEEIEEFFNQMAEELKKENIPILNNYIFKFKDYPTKEELAEKKEAERKDFDELEDDMVVEEN